jgi:hypothetical protein
MILGQEFVADMVYCAAPYAQLCKANYHDGDNDDCRIEAEPGGAKPTREDYANRQVAESHRKVASEEAEDISQVSSFCQVPGKNK